MANIIFLIFIFLIDRYQKIVLRLKVLKLTEKLLKFGCGYILLG